MRILFTRFPLESRHGGAEIQTISLMEGLRRRGHHVSFVGSCPMLLSLCKKHGIPAIELRIGPPPVTKWTAISFLWRKRVMRRKLLDALAGIHGLDAVFMLSLTEKLLLTSFLVHSRKYNLREAAGLVGPADGAIPLRERMDRGRKTAGLPFALWMEHDRIGRWLTRNPWLPLLKKQSAFATTITVSELSRSIFLSLGWDPKKTVAIPNGIDPDRFSSSTPIPSSGGGGEYKKEPPFLPWRKGPGDRGNLRLLCIARLSREKGIDLLIEAVKNNPDLELSILGNGREEQKLRDLAGGSPQIRFLPHTKDLSAFYASTDVLVLPSRDNDPFGLVAAEAMMLGIPVIVTDQCGIAGYLEDGKTAIIVKAGSSEALREGIERLQNPTTRKAVAEAGKTFAKREFSSERMVERYEKLLQKE